MTTLEEVVDRLNDHADSSRWIAVFVGAMAVLLSIASYHAGNANLEVMQRQVQITNTWAFYQAKNNRRTMLLVAADFAEWQAAAMTDSRAKVLESRAQSWRTYADELFSEKSTGEGMKELTVSARAQQGELEKAMKRGTLFDLAIIALQLAIVLASLAIVMGNRLPFVMSALSGGLGTFLLFSGMFS